MAFQAMEIEPISATQQSLMKIFSDEYNFSIPPYQRPYAWEETQTQELLDDISSMLDEALLTRDPVTYFLGSIVLIKKPGSPDAQVVDGQQRLTTLTIFLSVLRDLSEGRKKSNRHKYICQEGDPDRGARDQFRLIPRRQDAEFFRLNIQEAEATERLDGTEGATESQKHMTANAALLRNTLKDWKDQRRDDLVQFLLQRCYLVVISVSNVETAHRVFTVLNARGLDLAPTDILKADLLDRSLTADEAIIAQEWEDYETALGRDRFVDLFQHVRMIFQREKPRERLEVGFPKYVKSFRKDEPTIFMREILGRYASAYQTILSPSQAEEKFSLRARDHITNLLRLDNSDWLPVAIYYLARNKLKQQQAEEFLWALERLAYYMFVTRYDINSRIARYAKLLNQLADGLQPESSGCEIKLTRSEKFEFMDELDGPIYQKPRVRLPLLLRLDAILSDGGASYRDGIVTVEHVMPQNPKPDSEWLEIFDDDVDRIDWTHRLANLVLLTRAKNSQASNWDFDTKKDRYFSTRAGVASFKLTTTVLKEKRWDRNTLEERQELLLRKLADLWHLNYDRWQDRRDG